MMNIRSRTTAVAAAIAAALALAACGDNRDNAAATRSDATVAQKGTAGSPSTSSPYATDRVTADASNASARASGDAAVTKRDTTPGGSTASSSAATGDSATSRAKDRADSAVDRAANRADNATDRAAARADNAGDRAAAAAGDAALTAKVKAALMAEPGIDSLQIDVDTTGGRVTLTGEADTPQHRQRALQVARNVEGVNGVVDRMTVKR